MRIAFLTLEDRSSFVIDDDLAIAELAGRGIDVDEVPWRREADWGGYAGVIVRTTWDYQADLPGFLATLAGIEKVTRLANPLAMVRWNAEKTYLRELAADGIPIVPAIWGQGLAPAELAALPGRLGVAECVIKPVVSANADDTFRVPATLDDAARASIAARFVDRAWLAQPFVRAIVEDGEYSVFYFDGAASHAIRKRPATADFRVQEEHGGLIEAHPLEGDLRQAADRVVALLRPTPLQARVDLVRLDDGTRAVMEVEAIEPSLYFRTSAAAPARFADAVERWLSRPRAPSARGARAGAGRRGRPGPGA